MFLGGNSRSPFFPSQCTSEATSAPVALTSQKHLHDSISGPNLHQQRFCATGHLAVPISVEQRPKDGNFGGVQTTTDLASLFPSLPWCWDMGGSDSSAVDWVNLILLSLKWTFIYIPGELRAIRSVKQFYKG